MKVAMLISTPFPPEEGIGYYVYNLSKKLTKRGYEVTVITRGSLKTEENSMDDIKIIRVPFIPLYPFHADIHGFFVNMLFKFIEKNFDIVHIHTPLSPVPQTSLPIISTIHTSLMGDIRYIKVVDLKSLGTKILTRFISYPLVSKLIEKSIVITTVSNSVACELKEYYGLKNVVIVGNGVDEKIFSPTEEKNERNYLLYVGRLSYRKGLFDLLECAKLICQDYNVKFILVGKGELENKLMKEVRSNELSGKIIFLGHVKREKLIQLYQNATMFIFPSYYEGLPTVLLEAMACGLPLVATAVSGCIDIVKHGYNGLLVPPKSPEKMAEAIITLFENEKLRDRLGKNARKTIEEEYTWDKVTDRMEKCYELARNL